MVLQSFHAFVDGKVENDSGKVWCLQVKGDVPTAESACKIVGTAQPNQVVLVIDEDRKIDDFKGPFAGLNVVLCGNDFKDFRYMPNGASASLSAKGALYVVNACIIAQQMATGTVECPSSKTEADVNVILKSAGLIE